MSAVASALLGDRAEAAGVPPGVSRGVDPLDAPVAPPNVDPPPEDDAATRLARSRERLRRAMAPPPDERPSRAAKAARRAAASGGAPRPPLFETLRGLLARVRALPAADVLVDAVEVWWAAHPLHTAGSMAADASKAYVQPIARRNPIAFVAGSAALGALFFLTRPWRWALRPVLLAGLLPQIVSHALRRAPVGSWINVATAFAERQSAAVKRRTRAAGTPPAGDPGPAPPA